MVLLLIAVVVAGWYAYWDGLHEELAKAQATETTLKKEFIDKKKQAVNLPELKKQLVQVGQYVASLEKQLPSKAEMDALLTDINQSGLGRGLQFELFRPGSVSVKEYYAELPIAVRVTGSYHDLGAFASDIAQLSRIVTLNDMSITQSAPGAPLAMDTTAKTFRYLDGEEVASQRKAKAPAAKGGAKK
jgi:type IV pilus assembly protein PilO